MSAWKVKSPPILEIVTKDGPIWKEMQKPQIMHVKVNDYGLRKLYKRHDRRSPVRR